MVTTGLRVKHNIEVAHRLSLLPGKCEAIHGHSMWVEMILAGDVDERGLVAGLDFGSVKKSFRDHLDFEFDHRLLLNTQDPLVRAAPFTEVSAEDLYPGLNLTPGDPTTENISLWVAQWAQLTFTNTGVVEVVVEVHETSVNSAFTQLVIP